MSKEEKADILGSLGGFFRIIRMEGIGGSISEEGGLVKGEIEEDSLTPDGYQKVIATKYNVCDCGHVAQAHGRCSAPSCGRTLCQACCNTCHRCGRVFCGEHLIESMAHEGMRYCRSCQWKVTGLMLGRKLLGFGS